MYPTSSTREETGSPPRSSRSSQHPMKVTQVMVIEETVHSSSSSSEGKVKKGTSCFKLQNKAKKTPTTAIPIAQKRHCSINHLREDERYCRLCFNTRHQAEKCPFLPLQIRLTLLQKRENDKGHMPY